MGTIVSVAIGGVLVFFFVFLFVGMLSSNKVMESNGFVWNRKLPDFRYGHCVERAVGNDLSRDSLKNIAEAIFSDHIKGKKFPHALQGYIDLCSTIESIRHDMFGVPSCREGVLSEGRADDLALQLASVFAKKIQLDDSQIGIIERLINPPGFFAVKPDWYYEKVLDWLKSKAEDEKNCQQVARDTR